MKAKWMRRALRDLKRVDRQTRKRIVEGVTRFAENERGDIRKVEGTEEYALRIGDWRIFFESPEDDTVWVNAGRLRDKTYKK
jgi:mRNA-degrading endonuclease RelE of RelBE toxin-antitoxin system